VHLVCFLFIFIIAGAQNHEPVISIAMFISGANEPLQRWEMCVETLQRFMGFALASMQDLAVDETSKNAATNVVSVMVNGICSGNNAGSSFG
jgi:hypothetical protein